MFASAHWGSAPALDAAGCSYEIMEDGSGREVRVRPVHPAAGSVLNLMTSVAGMGEGLAGRLLSCQCSEEIFYWHSNILCGHQDKPEIT